MSSEKKEEKPQGLIKVDRKPKFEAEEVAIGILNVEILDLNLAEGRISFRIYFQSGLNAYGTALTTDISNVAQMKRDIFATAEEAYKIVLKEFYQLGEIEYKIVNQEKAIARLESFLSKLEEGQELYRQGKLGEEEALMLETDEIDLVYDDFDIGKMSKEERIVNFIRRAYYFYETDEPHRAIEDLRRALKLDKDNEDAEKLLRECKEELGIK